MYITDPLRRLWWLAALVAASAACGAESAAETPPEDAGADVAITGSIAGRVVLSGGGGVAGLAVSVLGPVSASPSTDASGAFFVDRLPGGRYAISVAVPSTLEGSRGTIVEVGDGAVTAPDFAFTALGDLTGKVTLGSPTGNAGIVVVVPGTASSGVTDDSGSYTIRGVTAGKHDVVASLPGWLSGTASSSVEYRKLTTAPDIVLVRPPAETGAIEGSITVTGESAHAGVTVLAVGPTGSAAAISDSSGAWSLKGLAPGKYSLSVTAPATVEGTRVVEANVEVGKTATLDAVSFTPLGTLRGKVTLGGRTTGNGGISVWVPDAPVVFTDDAGSWEIRNARTGVSKVSASKEGWSLRSVDGPKLGWRGDVTVDSMDLALDPTAVTKLSGLAKVVGRTSHEGTVVSLSGSTYTTTTAADGSYSLDVLGSGLRTLSFKSNDGLFETKLPNVMLTPGSAAFIVSGSSMLPIPNVRLSRGKWIGWGRPLGFTAAGDVITLINGATNRLDVLPTSTGTARTIATGINLGTGYLPKLPIVSPDGAWVVFRDATSAWNLVSTTSGPVEKLVGADLVDPRFLPDGKLLAYRTLGTSSTLALRTLATGALTTPATVGSSDVWFVSPSPDGTYVAAPASSGHAVVAKVDGTFSTEMKRFCERLEWTFDSRVIHSSSIVYSSAFECDLAIATPGASGPERQLFTSGVIRSQLSPDRKWLLAWRKSGSTYGVWLASLATTDAPVLLADDPTGQSPVAAFSADSSRVAFARSGGTSVNVMGLASGASPTEAGSFSYVYGLRFLGSAVVVQAGTYGRDLWVIPAGSAPKLLGTPAHYDLSSPDDTKAVWSSTSLQLLSASGTNTSLGVNGTVIGWSPDSARLAHSGCDPECKTSAILATGSPVVTALGWQQNVMWISPALALLTDWSQTPSTYQPPDESMSLVTFP